MKKLTALLTALTLALTLGLSAKAPSPRDVAASLDAALPIETTASTDWHLAPEPDRSQFVEMNLDL